MWSHLDRVGGGGGGGGGAVKGMGETQIEIDKRREDLAVFSEPCPGLAGLIELGAPAEELKVVVDDHVDALRRRIGRHPDQAILGCTHYPFLKPMLKSMLPESIILIDTGAAVARQLQRLLAERNLLAAGPNRPVRFWTSADPQFFRNTLPLLGQVAGDVERFSL